MSFVEMGKKGSFFNVCRVEDVKLRIQNVRGKMERGLIYSAGKDGLIKYWDLVK